MTAPYVCHRCIGDVILANEIEQTGQRLTCTYCNKTSIPSWDISSLADRVRPVFDTNYVLSASEPDGYERAMHNDSEIDYDWQREGDAPIDVICGLLVTSEAVAQDVIETWNNASTYDPRDGYEEDPFGSEACYVETSFDRRRLEDLWRSMKDDVTFRSRFFSHEVKDFLSHIFQNIGTLQGSSGRAIKRLSKKTSIFRGRVAWNQEDQRRILTSPHTELNAPPSKLSKAGRMNAAGVRVFYGAMDVHTCLAEIRAPVGATAVVGTFQLLRSLRVVDLKALERVYQEKSMFDPGFQVDGERHQFLRSLSRRLSAPVMPSDEQLDYVVTQIICEYISTLDPLLDGILYPSTQTGGTKTNIALFDHASHVRPSSLPKGTKTKVDVYQCGEDEEDFEIFIEHTKPVQNSSLDENQMEDDFGNFITQGYGGWMPAHNNIEPSLALLEDAIKLIEVQGVKYKTSHRPVRQLIRDSDEETAKGF